MFHFTIILSFRATKLQKFPRRSPRQDRKIVCRGESLNKCSEVLWIFGIISLKTWRPCGCVTTVGEWCRGTRRWHSGGDGGRCLGSGGAATRSVRGAWRVSKKHEVKDQRMGEVCEQGKYRKYEKRRKKSAGNVIFVVSLQPVPWYIKNNPPTLIVAGIRKLGYVLW